MDLNDPSAFSPGVQTQGAQAVIPQVVDNVVTTLLGAGATATIDVNVQTSPLVDMFVFADQIMKVQVFERSSTSGTFRQVGGDTNVPISTPTEVFPGGRRFSASLLRIVITNTGVAALTAHETEVLARSM